MQFLKKTIQQSTETKDERGKIDSNRRKQMGKKICLRNWHLKYVNIYKKNNLRLINNFSMYNNIDKELKIIINLNKVTNLFF